jgi:CheY-like chemotaxis protein
MKGENMDSMLKIVTVDDSALVAERLRTLLSEIEYAEFSGNAVNVSEALILISEQQPHVVILDIHLEDNKTAFNGMDLLTILRKQYPKMKIIMLTNLTAPQYRSTCLTLGADYFLDKSNDFENIPETLKEIAHSVIKTPVEHNLTSYTSTSPTKNMNAQRPKTIFVIDDDPIANMISTKIIQKNSTVNVTSFTNATEALVQLRQWTTSEVYQFPELIFLDINMPLMDGWEFLEEFQKLSHISHDKCCVIMLSSSIHSNDIEKSKTYRSVCNFISKPLTSEKIETLKTEHSYFQ